VLSNLIIRPEKLGDIVVSTPLFRAFKESFPDQQLHLLTDEKFADVLKYDPHIDKIITIPWKGRKRGQRPSFLHIRSILSSYSYEKAAVLYSGFEGWNWLCASLGIKEVAQLGGTKSALLFGHKMILRRDQYAERHIRDWYLDVAKSLGANSSDPNPEVLIRKEEVIHFKMRFPEYAKEAGRGVLLHLGGSPEGENVSICKFAEWVPEISSSLNMPVYLTGTPAEKKVWTTNHGSLGKQELLGHLSIREMMVAVSLAGIVVCNSTGIIHIASALGRPTLGLYTADPSNSSRVWGPLGKNSRCLYPTLEDFLRRRSEINSHDLVDLGDLIPVTEVISKLKELTL
jgi:ADP-heptose:LPS heptosyltransferase